MVDDAEAPPAPHTATLTVRQTRSVTTVVLTKSRLHARRASMTTLRVVGYPESDDPSVLVDGTIELGIEQRSQVVGRSKMYVATATLMLSPDELRDWLVAVAALLPDEARAALAASLKPPRRKRCRRID